MFETLEQLDQELFLWLNDQRVAFLDRPMWIISQIYGSIPFLLLIILYIARKKSLNLALWSLVGMGLVILLCDRISTELFKEVFQRYRPTHNLEIRDMVNTVTNWSGDEYRGGKYSFLSSHATNFFGLSTYFWFVIKPDKRWVFALLFGWAALVSYTRIYLGVHYPSDIIAGALLGILLGWISYIIFYRFYRISAEKLVKEP